MKKRMHPLQIVDAMFHSLRENIFLLILLFIYWRSDQWLIKYGRWAFIVLLIGNFIYIIISWFATKYEFKDQTIHMYQGVFKKKHSSVPLHRIQNVQRKTPFYYKIFGVTSLSLETGIQNEGASVTFDAVTNAEAQKIEQLLDDYRKGKKEEKHEETTAFEEFDTEIPIERTVHFNPTRKEVLKASFLSFSFLAIIPLTITGYLKLEDIIDIEDQMRGIFGLITRSWMSIVITMLVILIIAIIFGIVYAYIRYGKYEIASDEHRIYIRSGVLNEKSFSIRKERVQAIKINQPFLKKLLGLAEVNLISASSGPEEEAEISSLYPFLPKDRAYSILKEILPEFHIIEDMNKLPKEALYVKMLRIPWSVFIAFAIVWFYNFSFWWLLIPYVLFLYLRRFFTYRNTRYAIEGSYVQFKFGGLSSTLFLTTRKLTTEIEVEQRMLQRKFDLTTIKVHYRTSLLGIEILEDIPVKAGEEFTEWYVNRLYEVRYENS